MMVLTIEEQAAIIGKAQTQIVAQLNNSISRVKYAELKGLLIKQQKEIMTLIIMGDDNNETT